MALKLLHANDRPGHYPESWYAATATPLPPFAPLEGDIRADLAIVGAGYTGLSAAITAARAGLKVVVLEAQRVGFGASGRNGGQLGTGTREPITDITRHMDPAQARALWDLTESAKGVVHGLISDFGIEADYHPGLIHACQNAAGWEWEQGYAETLARDYGYDQITPLTGAETAAQLGTDAFAGGTFDAGAGHLHPLKLALGMARAARDLGVTIHEQSEVTALTSTHPARLTTARGTLTADHVILAANGYLGDLAPRVARRVMPINNFILATEPLGARAPLAAPIAVADDRFVVNYWRQTPDGVLLFGGGESYGYRFPRDIAAKARAPMLALYPALKDARITHAWGGTLAITLSRMPHLARLAPHILTASGYSGHGVGMATLAGHLCAKALTGAPEGFDLHATLKTPPFPGGATLRSPLLALAMSWYALRDRLGF